jgi:MobA/MobL family
MAIYMSRVKTFPRAKGARVTRAAAYRAGERIRDERTGQVYSYEDRQDVVYKEIIVPSEFDGNDAIAWTQDRSGLWNEVERTERRNAQLGREVMVVLPEELSGEQRTQLVRGYAQELADRYRCAVDTTIHLPRPEADERNHHAHMLMTPRQITPAGLGDRINLGLSGSERRALGLCDRKADLEWQRARWATVTNEALAAAGVDARIDHRGPRRMGKDREPSFRLPHQVYKIERETGQMSRVGIALRLQHRERVEARLKGPDELARVVRKQKEQSRREIEQRQARAASAEKKLSRAVLNKADLNDDQRNRREAARVRARENPSGLSAADLSVQRWLKWREAHPDRTPTPDEAARNWLAYREAEKTRGGSEREHVQEGKERERKSRDRSRDYGLEI